MSKKKREKKTDPRLLQTRYNDTISPNLPPCIICDLDGTLSMMNDRFPYDGASSDTDILNKSVSDILHMYGNGEGMPIFLFSGRNSDNGGLGSTQNWLKENVKFDYTLEMRKPDDRRKDTIVKQEMFDKHVRDKYQVLFVLDDRDMMVEHWRSMGLDCFQVYYGNF